MVSIDTNAAKKRVSTCSYSLWNQQLKPPDKQHKRGILLFQPKLYQSKTFFHVLILIQQNEKSRIGDNGAF